MDVFTVAAITWLVTWKVELWCSAVLIALVVFKKKYDDNVVVAGYLKQAIDAVATQLEKAPEVDEKDLKRSAKKKRRRDVRTKIAREARKANRASKKGKK
jgi:Na+/glutamate symporter